MTAARSLAPRLTDMIEAIEVVRANTQNVPLEAFEADRDRRWLVERAVEIISEASRLLSDEKARRPEIPWQQVAGIGSVLRHGYARIAPEIIWAVAHEHLPELDKVCRDELERERARERGDERER